MENCITVTSVPIAEGWGDRGRAQMTIVLPKKFSLFCFQACVLTLYIF
jgi:hypothetical protein